MNTAKPTEGIPGVKYKAVLSNRIYLTRTNDLHDYLLTELSYSLPPKRPGDPNYMYCDVTRINENVLTIPIGRADLIPDFYEIEDKRVLIPVNFPKFKFTLREDQAEVVDELTDSCLINANPSWGKAQPHYSKIKTSKGWTTMGDIQIGDLVITPDNTSSKVTNKFFHKNKPIYRITLYDGRQVDACEEHLWDVFQGGRKTTSTINTSEMKNYLSKSDRLYLPLCSPISGTDVEYLLDPYVLGVLIGDGGFTTKSTILSSADQFILDKVAQLLPKGHTLRHAGNYDYRIINDGKINKVSRALADYGLQGLKSHEKFIPIEYRNGSIETRLRVLQGLFDADGSVEKDTASFEYTTTSITLMNEVCEIIYSLGGIGTIQTRQTSYTYKGEKKLGRISYRMRPSRLPLELKRRMFSLPRKLERIKNGAYDNTGKIRVEKIEYIGNQDCYCITIDSPKKLYLTDNYIVTHNTFTGIAIALKLGQKTLVVVHTKALLHQWVKEVEKTLGIKPGIVGDGKCNTKPIIVIGMMQSLKNRMDKVRDQYGTIILDECHHMPATVFKTIIDACRARYKIGLSATLWRKDGKHVMLHDYTGMGLYQPKDNNRVPANIIIVNSGIPFSSDPKKPWAIRVNELMANDNYMELVLNLTHAQVQRGHKVLTVGARVDFLETCGSVLDNMQTIVGPTKDREIDLIKYDGIWGTSTIFAEGVNQPKLSSLVMAMPIGDNRAMLEQLIGRIERPYEGKMQPEAIDIALEGRTAKNQLAQRINFYVDKGYEIKYI